MEEVVPDAPIMSKVSKIYSIQEGKWVPVLQDRDIQIKDSGVNVCVNVSTGDEMIGRRMPYGASRRHRRKKGLA